MSNDVNSTIILIIKFDFKQNFKSKKKSEIQFIKNV